MGRSNQSEAFVECQSRCTRSISGSVTTTSSAGRHVPSLHPSSHSRDNTVSALQRAVAAQMCLCALVETCRVTH